MKDDLSAYIKEKYKKSSFRVVPGHLPKFKSKEDVDDYFEEMEMIMEAFCDKPKEETE